MNRAASATTCGDTSDMSPMVFFRSASAFLSAADREHQWFKGRDAIWSPVDAMPIYFLYGQAIELMLKAYLRATGVSSKELSRGKYGHNLLTLYRECREKLLITDEHCLAMIGILTAYFNEANWNTRFRYQSDFPQEFPALEAVSVFSRVLLEAVEPVCEGMAPLDAALLFVSQRLENPDDEQGDF